MTDQTDSPTPPSDDEAADATVAQSKDSLGESTPVRIITSAISYAATCMIAGGVVTFITGVILSLRGAEAWVSFGSLLTDTARTGLSVLSLCWLAMAVSVVATNSYLLGDRSVVNRRCRLLGLLSGLAAPAVLLAYKALRPDSPSAAQVTPFVLAFVALIVCLCWRSQEGRADEQPATDEPNTDDTDRSES